MGAAVYAALEAYSEQELQLILRFLDEGNALVLQEITALRRHSATPEQG